MYGTGCRISGRGFVLNNLKQKPIEFLTFHQNPHENEIILAKRGVRCRLQLSMPCQQNVCRLQLTMPCQQYGNTSVAYSCQCLVSNTAIRLSLTLSVACLSLTAVNALSSVRLSIAVWCAFLSFAVVNALSAIRLLITVVMPCQQYEVYISGLTIMWIIREYLDYAVSCIKVRHFSCLIVRTITAKEL